MSLPRGWEQKPLGEAASVLGGYAFSSKLLRGTGKYQLIRMSNLYGGNLDLKRSPVFIDEIENKAEKFLLETGDILISLTGTKGKRDFGYAVMVQEQKKLLLNQRVCKLKANPSGLDQHFLFFLLQTKQFLDPFFLSSVGGTGNQANVGTTDVQNIEVALPPLAEQKKIAEILSTWDQTIAKLEILKGKYLSLYKSISKKLLDKEYTKASPLDSLVVFIKDGTHGTHQDVKHGIPLLSAKDINANGKIKFSEPRRISVEDYKKLHRSYEIAEGDILLTVVGTIGRIAIVPKNMERFTVQRSVGIIRPKNGLEGRFLYHHIKSPRTQRELFALSNASAQAGVYLGELSKLLLRIPSEIDMAKFVALFDSVEHQVHDLRQKIFSIKKQKQGLMQKLLTGKVRVKL